MITDKCLNGTERICLAINKFPQLFKDSKYIVNIQGDEPYIDPLNIDIAITTVIKTIFHLPVQIICTKSIIFISSLFVWMFFDIIFIFFLNRSNYIRI